MTVVGTRVLKMHVDAAKKALAENLAAFLGKEIDGQMFARAIAEAVVTAGDGKKTYYCVGVRYLDGTSMVFGPLATFAAAEKTLKQGHVLHQNGAVGGVFPLIPPTK